MSKKQSKKQLRDESDDSEAGSDIEELVAAGEIDPTIAKPQKEYAYNKEGLKQCLNDIKQDLSWIERLDITATTPCEVRDINDDLSRELQFYNQVMGTVNVARGRFKELNEPFFRPDDFYAEMMKSDSHMQKIRDKLLFEQRKMAAVEQRKREQDARKYAKEVQAEKQKQKSAEKKANIEAVKHWKKTKDSREGMADDKEIDQMLSATTSAGKKRKAAELPKKSAKRRNKDKKYGAGGKKRYAKENNSKSAADTREYSGRRNKSLPAGMTMRKKGKKR